MYMHYYTILYTCKQLVQSIRIVSTNKTSSNPKESLNQFQETMNVINKSMNTIDRLMKLEKHVKPHKK